MELFEEETNLEDPNKFPKFYEYGNRCTHKFTKDKGFLQLSFFHTGFSISMHVRSFETEAKFLDAVRTFGTHGVKITEELFNQKNDYITTVLDKGLRGEASEFDKLFEDLDSNFNMFKYNQERTNRDFYRNS